jgi:hypothetical protein
MSKRKRVRTPVVTRDHIISTLTYIRTLVDALITALNRDFQYSQLPPPLRPDIPYRKDCPPPEERGKTYGKDCAPPEELPPTLYAKIYGKDCPPPEEVETVKLKVRPTRATTMTVVVPRKKRVPKKKV